MYQLTFFEEVINPTDEEDVVPHLAVAESRTGTLEELLSVIRERMIFFDSAKLQKFGS